MATLDFITRPALPQDDAFLYQLYADTRAEEIATWGWNEAQQEVFLKMQFQAQQRHYASQFPDAIHQIIISDRALAGRILVAQHTKIIQLVDIALLKPYRNGGIGTRLIQALQAEAVQTNKTLRLHLAKTNPQATRLYTRLGLTIVEDNGVYLSMQYKQA